MSLRGSLVEFIIFAECSRVSKQVHRFSGFASVRNALSHNVTLVSTAIFSLLRHQALVGDAGARPSRGQRGQHIALDRGVFGRGALPAGLSGVPERDDAFSRGGRGLLREGLPLRAAHQPLAAALRQDLSYEYVLLL